MGVALSCLSVTARCSRARFHNMSLKVQARHSLLLPLTFSVSMLFFDTDEGR